MPTPQQLRLTVKAEFAEYNSDEQTSCWALVSVKAPADITCTRAPLNLVLVVDQSASMVGQKMHMVKKTLHFIVNQGKHCALQVNTS